MNQGDHDRPSAGDESRTAPPAAAAGGPDRPPLFGGAPRRWGDGTLVKLATLAVLVLLLLIPVSRVRG